MLILIGPSASGKTEIANILVTKYKFKKIITCTTRPKRLNEVNGVHYHFLTEEEFESAKDNDEFIETICYSSYHYGTRKKDIYDDSVIILEPNGFYNFKKQMTDNLQSFYLNTSENVRFDRMIYRKDTIENINQRIENDRLTFKDSLINDVDYVIDNNDITLDKLADEIYLIYQKNKKIKEKKTMAKILVETSARHVHVSEADLKVLFGENAQLTFKKALSQPGQYACEERVTVVGPKKSIPNVSILGPARKDTQVELSATDARSAGIAIAIKESGDLLNTPGCKLVGPCGEVELQQGVIVAKRHIHITNKEASEWGLVDKEIVSVKVKSEGRSLVFGDVVVRVRDDFAPAMHIDTDESNAACVAPNTFGEIIK